MSSINCPEAQEARRRYAKKRVFDPGDRVELFFPDPPHWRPRRVIRRRQKTRIPEGDRYFEYELKAEDGSIVKVDGELLRLAEC